MNLSREVKAQAHSICLLHIPEGVEISSFSLLEPDSISPKPGFVCAKMRKSTSICPGCL